MRPTSLWRLCSDPDIAYGSVNASASLWLCVSFIWYKIFFGRERLFSAWCDSKPRRWRWGWEPTCCRLACRPDSTNSFLQQSHPRRCSRSLKYCRDTNTHRLDSCRCQLYSRHTWSQCRHLLLLLRLLQTRFGVVPTTSRCSDRQGFLTAPRAWNRPCFSVTTILWKANEQNTTKLIGQCRKMSKIWCHYIQFYWLIIQNKSLHLWLNTCAACAKRSVTTYVPCSTICPSSMTRMRWAWMTVERRWATMIVVLSSHIFRRLRWMCRSVRVSSADVACTSTWLNSHTCVRHYHKTLIYLQATLYPKRRVTVHNERNWFLQHRVKISLWLDGTNVVDWLTDWPHPTGQSLAPWGWFWRWLFAVSRRRWPLTRALPHGCCMLMIHTETEPCWLFGCFQGCRRCICCSRILARLTCHCH